MKQVPTPSIATLKTYNSLIYVCIYIGPNTYSSQNSIICSCQVLAHELILANKLTASITYLLWSTDVISFVVITWRIG